MRQSLLHLFPALPSALCIMSTLLRSEAAPPPLGPAAQAVNQLGIDLLHQTAKADANALLSPYSIQSALAMAYAGSDGVTREEMARVLHYPKDETGLHDSFAAWRKALEQAVQASEGRAQQSRQYFTNDPLVLTVANRLFGQPGYDFRPPFLSLLSGSYAAPFEPLDFSKNPALAAKHINEWVENQTRQRIGNVIPGDAFNKLTRLVLVNALYLKAPWRHPFEISTTRPGGFYAQGSQPVDVPMMSQRHELPFAQGNGFVAVNLPLESALEFLIFLPAKRTGLAELEQNLSPEMLAGKLKWEMRDVTLVVPRFKLEPAALSLSEALQELGMHTAFDIPQGSANFDRLAPRRPGDYLAISHIFHKTYLDLAEKGIEAAAATAIQFNTHGIHEPRERVEVRVDHPFLFALIAESNSESGAASLFLGHVTDPRSNQGD